METQNHGREGGIDMQLMSSSSTVYIACAFNHSISCPVTWHLFKKYFYPGEKDSLFRNIDQMEISISLTDHQKLSIQAYIKGIHISFWKINAGISAVAVQTALTEAHNEIYYVTKAPTSNHFSHLSVIFSIKRLFFWSIKCQIMVKEVNHLG